MKVRQLYPWEREDVIPFAERFHAEAEIGGTFDPEALMRTIKAVPSTVIGLFEGGKIVGALAGVITPHFLTTDNLAQELMWYVSPEHRGCLDAAKMLTHFMKWAQESGATAISMVALESSNPSVGKLYKKKGFKAVETQFLKFF